MDVAPLWLWKAKYKSRKQKENKKRHACLLPLSLGLVRQVNQRIEKEEVVFSICIRRQGSTSTYKMKIIFMKLKESNSQ